MVERRRRGDRVIHSTVNAAARSPTAPVQTSQLSAHHQSDVMIKVLPQPIGEMERLVSYRLAKVTRHSLNLLHPQLPHHPQGCHAIVTTAVGVSRRNAYLIGMKLRIRNMKGVNKSHPKQYSTSFDYLSAVIRITRNIRCDNIYIYSSITRLTLHHHYSMSRCQ